MKATVGGRLGRYQLHRRLGRGGEGEVFLALDSRDRKTVAIKVINGDVSSNTSERARREASFIASLADPNIVRILALGHHQQTWYIVMEYVDGGSIYDQVRAHGPLDITWALRLVAEAGSALHSAHKLGILHFDVTPKNMLFERKTGSLRLADFGLAQLMKPKRGTRYMGTPQYTAPEVWAGRPVTPMVDSYSLGLSLYFLIEGVPAISSREISGCQRAHDRGELIVPADWPEGLRELFMGATARAPEQRLSAREISRRAAHLAEAWPPPAASAPEIVTSQPGSASDVVRELTLALDTGVEVLVLMEGNRTYRRHLIEQALVARADKPPVTWLTSVDELRSEALSTVVILEHEPSTTPLSELIGKKRRNTTLIVSSDEITQDRFRTAARWRTPRPDLPEAEALIRRFAPQSVEGPVLITPDAVLALADALHRCGPSLEAQLAEADARRRTEGRGWLGTEDLSGEHSHVKERRAELRRSLGAPLPLVVSAAPLPRAPSEQPIS